MGMPIPGDDGHGRAGAARWRSRRSISTATRPKPTGSWRDQPDQGPHGLQRDRRERAGQDRCDRARASGPAPRRIHSFGPARLGHWVRGRRPSPPGPGSLLGGLGIVEDGHDRARRGSRSSRPSEIGGPAEAARVDRGQAARAGPAVRRRRRPRHRAGWAEDKSGSGMDTNVIGRMMIRGTPEFERPRITNIVVLDLTPTRRTATRPGSAWPTSSRSGSSRRSTWRRLYLNSLTSGSGRPARASCRHGHADRSRRASPRRGHGVRARPSPSRIRLARIRDTLDLGELWLSPGCWTTWPGIRDRGPGRPRGVAAFEGGRLVG